MKILRGYMEFAPYFDDGKSPVRAGAYGVCEERGKVYERVMHLDNSKAVKANGCSIKEFDLDRVEVRKGDIYIVVKQRIAQVSRQNFYTDGVPCPPEFVNLPVNF